MEGFEYADKRLGSEGRWGIGTAIIGRPAKGSSASVNKECRMSRCESTGVRGSMESTLERVEEADFEVVRVASEKVTTLLLMEEGGG